MTVPPTIYRDRLGVVHRQPGHEAVEQRERRLRLHLRDHVAGPLHRRECEVVAGVDGVRGEVPGDVLVHQPALPAVSDHRPRLRDVVHVLAYSCSRDYPSGLQL